MTWTKGDRVHVRLSDIVGAETYPGTVVDEEDGQYLVKLDMYHISVLAYSYEMTKLKKRSNNGNL